MCRSQRGIGNTGTVLLVALVLFLAFPAQHSAAILNGAITWNPEDFLLLTDTAVNISNTYIAVGGCVSFDYHPEMATDASLWSLDNSNPLQRTL